jgi:hypothetical protein
VNPDAIQMLDRTLEVHVATSTKPLPIWAVVVDGEAVRRPLALLH